MDNFKELYLFNPFKISEATVTEIADTYTKLQGQLESETEQGWQIAKNIELYSNMYCLLGEVIARTQEEYDTLKMQTTIRESQAVYSLRDNYISTNADTKIPAMVYFESKAKQTVQVEYNTLAKLNAKLTRFKKFLDATEMKMNALKKKIEVIRYEI